MRYALLPLLFVLLCGCPSTPVKNTTEKENPPEPPKIVLPEEPNYPVKALSPFVEFPGYSKYDAFNVKEEYQRIDDAGFQKMLAAEYHDFVGHLRKVVAAQEKKTGPSKLEVSYDKTSGKMNASVINTPFNQAVTKITGKAGLSCVIHPSLVVRITFSLRDAAPEKVISLAAKHAGAKMENIKGVFSFKPGEDFKPPSVMYVADIELPEYISPMQCKIYYHKQRDLFYGQVVVYHRKKAALYLVYTLKRAKISYDVIKLEIYATRLVSE